MNGCPHSRTIPGMEGDWCPDCQCLIPQAPSPLKGFERDVDLKLKSLGTGDLNQSGTACGSSPVDPGLPSKRDLNLDRTACGNKSWHFTQVYRSHGSLYYRYICGVGHKVDRYVHIPGGNTDNPIAQARREQVDRWIRQGHAPEAITKAIAKWR